GAKYVAHPPAADAFAVTGFSAAALTQDYLESGSADPVLGFVRARVEAALAQGSGPTYAEVLRSVERRPEDLSLVPGSLPYEVTGVHEELAFVPEEAKHRVRVTVHDAAGVVMEATLPLHRLVGHRTLLAWDPATEADATAIAAAGGLYEAPASAVQLLPVFRVDGVPQATGSRSVGLGVALGWKMELLLPGGSTRVIPNEMIAGNFVAIGFGGPGNRYVEMQDDAGYRDGPAVRFLYARAAEYANAWTEAEEELAKLLQVVPVRPTASVVIVENQLAVDEVLGVRRRVVWKGLQVDADHRTMVPLELVPGRAKELLRLSGYHGSFLEAEVLRAATGTEAVAAISVVQEALRRGAPVLTITQANAGAQLGQLVTTPGVLAEVEDHVARGREVIIPAEDLTIANWTGTGFISRDPGTEEAGYFLAGVVSGGQTIVSPGSWLDQDLVRELEGPDAPAATTDTSLVARIIKRAGDGQEVVVGERAPYPLTVYVTTLAGVPVQGANVTFRSAGTASPRFAATASGVLTQDRLELRTDHKGIARAWIDPDTRISAQAILRAGDPNAELVGLNEVMAETQGPGTPIIAVPFPFITLARHDAPASIRMDCSMADGSNYCERKGQAGLQMGSPIRAFVLDRFQNAVPNATLVWTSSQAGGRFVDLALVTDGSIRVLDPTDPMQVSILTAKTSTFGEARTDYIPGRLSKPSTEWVDLTATVGSRSGPFRLLVTEPGTSPEQQFAFKLRHDQRADLAGIFGGKFLMPVGGQVFRWVAGAQKPWVALTGLESDVERIQVQMDAWDVTTTPKVLFTRTAEPWPTGTLGGWESFDDAQTATFLPGYEVDGGVQRHEFHAKVTLRGKGTVECAEWWSIRSESRRPTVETLRILPGWTEKPTDEFGYASRDDLAVAFRINNPAGHPIYARIVPKPRRPGDPFVSLPPPDEISRHPDDPTLMVLLGHSRWTLTLLLDPGTEGGEVQLQLLVPDTERGLRAVRPLGYATRRIRVAPPGTSIASGDDLLRASIILPVRNYESTATPPRGTVAPSTSTEPPILVPAELEFRVKGKGTLSVTSGGALVARAEVDADPETGDLRGPLTPVGNSPLPGVRHGSLFVRIAPADPTVNDVTIAFADQTSILPFETVIKDAGALPVGHTFVKDVSVVDGHLSKSFTDISVAGRNGGLTFSRSYTSRGFEEGPLGTGWTHSYRSFVLIDTSGG
ncbi:MAG TPA: DUF6531 domain-containing protein, partial [Actinomycetota bacterium]|nr:DUF6531 domain-containing protein [Actinomycetota bacterium]